MSIKKIEGSIIWFLLFGLLTCHVLYFKQSLPHMVPNPAGRSDEMDYFTDAKLFYLTNSLCASVSLDESVSRVGECGGHGFAYALFYGTVGKLVCGSDRAFILGNIGALLLALLYLYKQPFDILKKNLIAVLILSYFITVMFLQAYMVDVLNTSFAIILSIYFFSLFNENTEKKLVKKSWLFFALVLICASFRITYVFFLFGLIPLAGDRKSYLRHAFMILLGFAYISLFVRFFVADMGLHPKSFVYLLLTGDSQLASESKQLLENLTLYFRNDPAAPGYFFYYKYILVILPLLQLYFFTSTKEKIYLVPFFISTLYLIVVFFLYGTAAQSDSDKLRHLSEVFAVNSIFLVLCRKPIFYYALITIALFTFPAIYDQVQNNPNYGIQPRLRYWQYFSEKKSRKTIYDTIADYKSEKNIITVQLPTMAMYEDIYLMPLISKEGKPIRYNFAHFKPAPKESKFVTHYFNTPAPE